MLRGSIPITLVDLSHDSYVLTPQLQRLLAQAWRDVVHEGHSTIDEWSILLLGLKNESQTDLIDEHVFRVFGPDDMPSIIRYIASVTPRLVSISPHDFSRFWVFLSLFTRFATKSTDLLLKAPGSCHIPVLSQLLTKVLQIRHEVTTGRRVDIGLDEPAFLTAEILLTSALDGPDQVSQALASGLLSTFIKKPHRLATLPMESQKALCVLLDTVSRYMVYPKVLREFSRAVRKEGSIIDSNTRPASLLWDCWRNCLEKAAYLYTIRQNLKADGALYRCSVAACTNIDVIKFKRCSACKALYCSESCQQLDWASGHRAHCSSSDAHRNGARLDLGFLESVVTRTLTTNAGQVTEIIDSYSRGLRRQAPGERYDSFDDDQLIATKQNYPVLLFKLSTPGLLVPSECIEATNTAIFASVCELHDIDIVPAWRSTGYCRLFVVARMPTVRCSDTLYAFDLSWPPPGSP
ncbi:hypothetical protein AAF712_015661 [Marasmius tenuissimus]|uniref:MYND-type domain-containing protein n=1 Tax=Marasmius tenuissimus TaxID=585030 RepID=A0ABR2Z8S1_9AGAR